MKIKNIITLLVISSFTLFNSCDQSNAQLFDLVLEIKSQNNQLLNEVKTLQLKSDLLIAELRLSAAKQEELLLKVTDLQGQLSTILSQINSLNQQLKAQDVDIQLIKNQLADLQTQYQGIFKQLEELQKLSQVLAEIEKMKTQITQLDTRYTTILAGLVQNKQQLDALKTQITSTQTQLADNLTKISQLISQLGDQGVVLSNILKQIELIKNNNAELIKLLESLLLGKNPIPTDGLIGWWPFNGNANDESGNGNNGSIYGSVNLTIDRKNAPNAAYSFAGNSNSFINIGSPNILKVQDEITLSVWFTMTGGYYNPRLLQFGCGGQEFVVASLGTNSTLRDMDIGISGLIIRVPNVNASNWVNLIYTAKRSTGSASVYLNGTLIKSIQIEPILSNLNYTTDFNIGRMACPANDAWGGKIDDIGIWNRALTAAEVSKIYLGQGF